MDKQSYIRQITGAVAALACIAAIAGCRASSSQAQSDPNAKVAPCVANKTCPGYPSNPPAIPGTTIVPPPPKLPGQP